MAIDGTFAYDLKITGDCQSNHTGSISITPLDGTPNYDFEWVNPSLGADYNSSFSVRTGLSGGSYEIRVTDSSVPDNIQETRTIFVSTGVCVSVISLDTTCNLNNGSFTAITNTFSNQYDYFVYKENDLFDSGTTTSSSIVYNDLDAGLYEFEVKDFGGCEAKSKIFEISTSENIDYGLFVVNNTECLGPTGKIFVTGCTGPGPFTYLWSPNGETTSYITGLTEGSYSVTVSNELGCSVSKGAQVFTVPPLGLGTITSIPPTCFNSDGSITISVTGGTEPFFYSGSNGDSQIYYGRTYTFDGLSSGAYQIRVQDCSLCEFSTVTSIQSPNGFSVVSLVTENSYCNINKGKVTLTINGIGSPFTYTLIDPSGNTRSVTTSALQNSFENLSQGTYTIGVSNSSGCQYQEEFDVYTSNKYTISASTTGTTCGQKNGKIYAEVSPGGSPPYSFYLNNELKLSNVFLTSYTFTLLDKGNYTVKVIDSENCEQTYSIIVPEVCPPLNFSLETVQPSLVDPLGKINAFITNGTPPFSFFWDKKNESTNTYESYTLTGNLPTQITGVTSGNYRLTINDSCGCTRTRTTDISIYTPYSHYDLFSFCEDNFEFRTSLKRGILEMTWEGYEDIVTDYFNCELQSTTFEVIINVKNVEYKTTFYTGQTINDVPSENLLASTIENLLNTIPGITDFSIDLQNNQVTIQTKGNCCQDNVEDSLCCETLEVSLKINYDIICNESLPDLCLITGLDIETYLKYAEAVGLTNEDGTFTGPTTTNDPKEFISSVLLESFSSQINLTSKGVLNGRPYYSNSNSQDVGEFEIIWDSENNRWVLYYNDIDIFSLNQNVYIPTGDTENWVKTKINSLIQAVFDRAGTISGECPTTEICILLINEGNPEGLIQNLDVYGVKNERLYWKFQDENFDNSISEIFWTGSRWEYSNKNEGLIAHVDGDVNIPISNDWTIDYVFSSPTGIATFETCPQPICVNYQVKQGVNVVDSKKSLYFNGLQNNKFIYSSGSNDTIAWNGVNWELRVSEYIFGPIAYLNFNTDTPIGTYDDWSGVTTLGPYSDLLVSAQTSNGECIQGDLCFVLSLGEQGGQGPNGAINIPATGNGGIFNNKPVYILNTALNKTAIFWDGVKWVLTNNWITTKDVLQTFNSTSSLPISIQNDWVPNCLTAGGSIRICSVSNGPCIG